MKLPYLMLIPLLLFIACSSPSKKQQKTVFRYNAPEGITSLDPAFSRSQANIWAVNQLFNGLVQLDDKLNVQPCIAKNWDISNDGTSFTFHLRNDVFFHDHPVFPNGKGRRVTASDFEYSFKRVIDPKTASPGAWIFSNIKDFHATDDSTFLIQLKKPFPPFLGLLSTQYCSVVPTEVVTYYGKDFRNHPIGTGPFVFHLWKEDVKLVLHKNEHYFEFQNGKRLPNIDAVAISFIHDKQAAFMEFIQGRFDFFNSIDVSYKDELITKSGTLNPKYTGKFRLEVMPFLNTEYLGILVDTSIALVKNSPLRLKKIRQAINYGFNREQMITYLRNNIGTAANSGFTPMGLPSFSASAAPGYTYNPEKARKLLQEAGFPNGKGLPEITLSTITVYADLCEYIQSQLADIGIKVKIEIIQGATHREMVAKQQLAFFRGSWLADYPDAENYLSLFYSPNYAPIGPNTTHFSNKHYDELYDRSLSVTDTARRYQYYREMEKIIIEEAPVVVLFYDKSLRLYQNNVGNISGNPVNMLDLRTVTINQ
jgi:peptide/nickel transport system substrate-binding protein